MAGAVIRVKKILKKLSFCIKKYKRKEKKSVQRDPIAVSHVWKMFFTHFQIKFKFESDFHCKVEMG